MAIGERMIKGVVREGRVELEVNADLPDGTLVNILVPAPPSSDEKREAALRRLRAAMNGEVHLGGGPYPTREELYGETGRPR